ncbi:P-loop containing nucleoside triphosphate hydrolase protein [Suillus subaureus]|uniref:P-loop containing nucleoside triphosphate hydrolase protein n=1 Tax=Suillus subaureus TaxID=48587 RepID=A0A9P7EH66_9AGAM|nr:P-loop containing nucleoside triphosphate hydrolase protein [Suillus subaureus]KAG1820850.1 P-loop containing nucleoside triphosphate hydrolase protein [Suillus subaureus]
MLVPLPQSENCASPLTVEDIGQRPNLSTNSVAKDDTPHATRGVYDPPGCGKTLLANTIAGELGVPVITGIPAPFIVSGLSGESENTLQDTFDEAKIDTITPKRIEDKPVVVTRATNRPDSLDAVFRSAGRLDHEISMDALDEEARKIQLDGDFNSAAFAKATPGYVGADLSALTGAAGVGASSLSNISSNNSQTTRSSFWKHQNTSAKILPWQWIRHERPQPIPRQV